MVRTYRRTKLKEVVIHGPHPPTHSRLAVGDFTGILHLGTTTIRGGLVRWRNGWNRPPDGHGPPGLFTECPDAVNYGIEEIDF